MHVRRDALALRDAGFDVDIICDREQGRPTVERIDGITAVRIPPRHRRGGLARYAFEYATFPLIAAIITALRSLRGRYHWIEINNMPDWLILAAVLPKLLGTKVVLYSREDMARLLASDHDVSMSHPAVRLLLAMQRICAGLADRIITTQDLARQDLIQQGIPAGKIVVIPNSPDEAVFLARVPKLSARATPARNGHGSFRLVTHGTLVKRYGIETLLQSMAILRNCIPGIHLEIVGDGECRQELETLANRLGLEASVTFAGYLPDYEQVAPQLLQADLGVVALWTDFQLCNKLVDYLALGLPAITTESAALRPYLDDNAVCYIRPKDPQALADAVTALYRDPDRRAALATAGQVAYRKHFAWERVKQDYLAVYATRVDRSVEWNSAVGNQPQEAGQPRGIFAS